MSDAPWLDNARKDLGLHEIPGPEAAKRIKQMFFTVGHPEVISDEISWCAAATGTWLREAGYPTSQPLRLNLTGASYEDYGRPSAPRRGAIIVSTYTRLGKKDWRRHVGIIATDPKPGAKSYKVIGGNQGDSVSIINVPIKKVTAIRWPVKEGAVSTPDVVKPDPLPTEKESSGQPTYTTSFFECLHETLKWEGGYSNDKYDEGGATMRGVTYRRYNQYRKDKGLPIRNVKHIADDELHEIYHTYYWSVVRGDELPNGIDLAVFDFGVNSGPNRAVRYLQKALGVTQDGIVGPITREALRVCDVEAVVKSVCDDRLRFVKQIKTFWRFGRGWTRRIAGIRSAALARVGVPDENPVTPLEDFDAQSREQGRSETETPKLDPKTVGGLAAGGAGAAGAAAQTPIPENATEAVQSLTVWQQIALFFKDFLTTVVDYWEWFLVAGVVWAGIVYAIPELYRRFRK